MASANHINLAEKKKKISETIESISEKLSSLSNAIWHCPELAYNEKQAHDILVDFFTSDGGWKVEQHYILDTAFKAEWVSKVASSQNNPIHVGFLCEYDALPEIGHACGHNLIAEVGAGTAVALKAVLDKTEMDRQVKITVLGTPAEEQGGGKADMLQANAFQGLDAVFMAHPTNTDAAYIPSLALQIVKVKYFGKTAHGAAFPWTGKNALDASVIAYNSIAVLRQQLHPLWKINGVINHKGDKPNVISAFSEILVYLRTPQIKDLSVLYSKVEQCFKGAAQATQCKVEVTTVGNIYYGLLRNRTLEALYEENARNLGVTFTTDERGLKSHSYATDFGNVSFAVPGIHAMFSIGSKELNHTEQYTEAAGSTEAQHYTLRAAKALSMTALDVICRPELVPLMKNDWEAAIRQSGMKVNGRL